MKNAKAQAAVQVRPAAGARHTKPRIYRTQVAEGDVIHFAPTGEQLRIAKIDKGEITFEKLP